MDEAELIERAREGDRAAFEALVRGRAARVYWQALQVVGRHEDALDVSQQVFIRLWRSLDRYDPSYAFGTWLYRMVLNLAIDHLRREGRHRHGSLDDAVVPPPAAVSIDTPESAARGQELRRVFLALAERLAPQQRAVFVLREVEERSSEEVAELLGISPSTVRNHLFQARRSLRRWLQRDYPELLPESRRDRGEP